MPHLTLETNTNNRSNTKIHLLFWPEKIISIKALIKPEIFILKWSIRMGHKDPLKGGEKTIGEISKLLAATGNLKTTEALLSPLAVYKLNRVYFMGIPQRKGFLFCSNNERPLALLSICAALPDAVKHTPPPTI